ncbi:hypothetical protein SAMN05216170_0830 [Thermococcus thioreducens]|uniref:Uncharacterized protein n=1 Tax=Thermococcus thioreducens TaxID=277988 RepID=A0A1I0MT75_9EURY|nr:hypothetical protein SAMN05216170_0830 [Thermococcus thioreducens]
MFRKGTGEIDKATELVGAAIVLVVGAYVIYQIAITLFGS